MRILKNPFSGLYGYGYGVAGVWNDIYSKKVEPGDFGTVYEMPARYFWWFDGANFVPRYYDSIQIAANFFDGQASTDWQAKNGKFANEWLQVDFRSTVTFNSVVLSEYGSRTHAFKIEF